MHYDYTRVEIVAGSEAAGEGTGGDVRQQSGGWQGAKGGEMTVDMPGQHVLERTSILISGQVESSAPSLQAKSPSFESSL